MRTIQLLKQYQAGTLLDIACGNGGFTKILKDSFGRIGHITGVDLSERGEQGFYETLGRENTQFVHQDIRGFLAEKRSFDAIALSYSLHHIPEIAELLEIIPQHLNANGLCIIREMFQAPDLTPAQKTQYAFHHLAGRIDRARGDYHAETYHEAGLRALLASVKLSRIHEEIYDPKDEIEREKNKLNETSELLQKKIDASYPNGAPREILDTLEGLKKQVSRTGFSGPRELIWIGKKQSLQRSGDI